MIIFNFQKKEKKRGNTNPLQQIHTLQTLSHTLTSDVQDPHRVKSARERERLRPHTTHTHNTKKSYNDLPLMSEHK